MEASREIMHRMRSNISTLYTTLECVKDKLEIPHLKKMIEVVLGRQEATEQDLQSISKLITEINDEKPEKIQ